MPCPSAGLVQQDSLATDAISDKSQELAGLGGTRTRIYFTRSPTGGPRRSRGSKGLEKAMCSPSTVGKAAPLRAPGPTATPRNEPEGAQAMSVEELLQADPKKGHDTHPCATKGDTLTCWFPGGRLPDTQGRCRDSVRGLTRTPRSRR